MRFFALIGLTLTAVMISASPIVEDNAAADENIMFVPGPFYKRALEDTNEGDRSLYHYGGSGWGGWGGGGGHSGWGGWGSGGGRGGWGGWG
ncbi:hypothetical protein BGZ92_006963, partial [Podila epicladia]